MVKLVEVIICSICRGAGTEENRYRTVTQLWTKSGKLIAESDTGPLGDQPDNPIMRSLLSADRS